MDPYKAALIALFAAAIAQTCAAWIAVELFRRCPNRSESLGWLAMALASGLLTLDYGRTLEIAVNTGIYDGPQAMIALPVSLLFTLGLYAIRHRKD